MQRGVATGAGPNTPHGGELKGKMLTEKSEIDAAVAACNGVTMELNERQLCDVESLCNGSFSPIEVRSARNVANASGTTGRASPHHEVSAARVGSASIATLLD